MRDGDVDQMGASGIRVHRVRRLDPRDVTTERGIPVTTIHRMFVDLTDVRTPHEIAALIREAAFRGRFVEAAVRDSMERANGRHNLHVLERAIEVYRAGSATPEVKRDDAIRDRILMAAGYTVLRFPEEVLQERPDEVRNVVANALESLKR